MVNLSIMIIVLFQLTILFHSILSDSLIECFLLNFCLINVVQFLTLKQFISPFLFKLFLPILILTYVKSKQHLVLILTLIRQYQLITIIDSLVKFHFSIHLMVISIGPTQTCVTRFDVIHPY